MDQPSRALIGVPVHSPGDSTRSSEPTISCVLPWQGSANALRRLILPLLDDVSALVRLWELILVDDGCLDADANAMAAWAEVEGVRIVRLTRHFGRDAAIAAGLQVAHGEVLVVLQGDDARASELIAGLLLKWRQGFNVVHSADLQIQAAPPVAQSGTERSLAPRVRLESIRTAHRVLLIDCHALADLAAPRARGSGSNSGQAPRALRVIAVPTPPLLSVQPPASSRFGVMAKKALGNLRASGRTVRNWLAPSAVDPAFEIGGELGQGLAPRAGQRPPQDAGSSAQASPHA